MIITLILISIILIMITIKFTLLLHLSVLGVKNHSHQVTILEDIRRGFTMETYFIVTYVSLLQKERKVLKGVKLECMEV